MPMRRYMQGIGASTPDNLLDYQYTFSIQMVDTIGLIVVEQLRTEM